MADEVPENIDRFNRVTLAVFADLYESFPIPTDFDSKIVGIEAAGDLINSKDDAELASAWMEAARTAVTWLEKEGFLRWKMATLGGEFFQVVLTQKGLNVLSQVPSSIKENPEKVPLGKLAKSTLASGAKGLVADVAKEVIGIAIKAASGL